MNPEDALADRTVLTAIRLTRWLRAADPSPNLSGPQASALAVIVHSGRIRMSDLARREEVTRPSITRTATELIGLGLILRDIDAADRRVSWLSATETGRAVLAEGKARRLGPLRSALSALPVDDRRALADGVAVLEAIVARAIADATGGSPPCQP